MAEFNITNPNIIKMLKGLTEEGRQGVADQLQESLDSGEVKKIVEDTKGIHPEPSEDSLIRDLKKENIRLKSLCRRASEEIRDLDDMIIKSIENNKVIEYPEEDKAYSAGFSSINLLNRLDGITSGGYVENYDDLNLEMKTLDGHYQAEHPSFYQAAEQVIDDHKETLQKLADNPYPYRHIKEDCVAYQEGGMGCPDCYDFICDVCGKKHNSMERHTLKTEQLSGVVMCEDCSGGNTTDRVEEDILDDEDEQLYDRLIKEIIAECHSETLDWDEDRMRARLRKVLETT